MLLRILTGIWAGFLFLFFLLIGGWPFALFIGALSVIAFLELISMKKIKPTSIESILGVIVVFLLVLKGWKTPWMNWVHPTELFMGLVLLLLLMTVFSKNRVNIDQATYIVFAVLYVGYGFEYLVSLRFNGLVLVLFVQIMIWATDSGAYFVGRQFGKHKLAPAISPNKTIEGTFGGIGLALVAAFIYQFVVGEHALGTTTHLILITLLISVFGQLGDLAESALKRHYNVKDSGRILPGHGGILDRFDSLIFVLPVLHMLHML
ncbi:phosphatidate cytidylyltransferase [Pullulanibacillus sp. KACC 23026]|uniref:phosphatidate cytidylyltransferase n=1 Tax=Pullulanibacillus sp. KACC 23026 TaxID=3028315 RepID=UPI0023AF66DA|nr:phosphatidate cytidylyltransferase [Pullulanibacillus sp. KACC 23026]WEG11589.1 phosphatidate cytidylyltransferase [Pullulanibacillus sp. KACC 23026]